MGPVAALVLLALAAAMPSPARADAAPPLTLERLLADPALSGPAPRALAVSPDGRRVTFLRGKEEDQNVLDLWAYDVASKRTRRLVDARSLGGQGGDRVSAEEQARRERARIAALRGIVEYAWSPDGRALLFPLDGALYHVAVDARGAGQPRRLTSEGYVLDPKVSPGGRYVSFVRDRELWVVEIASGRESRLTHDSSATVANGIAEFVADEEMGRHTGYWWAPDDSAIAFAQVDESPVPMRRRFEILADRTEVVEQRYPAAGEANARVRLGVVAPRAGAKPAWLELGEGFEYLARVHWIDAGRLAFQRQTRDQRRLELVEADLRTGARRVLREERAATFVNLHDDFRLLPDGEAFLWSTERDGTRQLVVQSIEDGRERRVPTPWPIDAVLAVAPDGDTVFVAAAGEDAAQKHVYAVALSGRAAPKRITARDGWHEATFATDASVFIDVHSDLDQPPQVRLHRAKDGDELAVLEANRVAGDHPYAPYAAAHARAEFGTLRGADGTELPYRVTRPADFDPARRWPVVVRVYGGPHAQLVGRAWDARWGLFEQYLARRGFVVFSLDNRGSARRGKAFEEAVHRRLGVLEVADQLAGIDWLRAQDWVDPARVGVFGWSYGGYMSLMLATAAEGRLAAVAAGAPVTDWRLYDTHYTERYLDLPSANPEGYARTVMSRLEGLDAPLLVVHGMADDNVLFTHTTQLMTALQQRGTPFELMTYPGEKHGVSTPAMRLHAYRTIAGFLERHLMPAAEARRGAAGAPSPP